MHAAYDYRGSAGIVVRRAKLEHDAAALGFLGQAICRLVARRDARFRKAVVVPVPLARSKERQRGFNQAAWLGARLAARLDVPLRKALRRCRVTETQGSQASKRERRTNVAGAFDLTRASARGAMVVLVDDVMTSGATLRECARVLARGGCGPVHAFVVART